jgi:hypothetical protein
MQRAFVACLESLPENAGEIKRNLLKVCYNIAIVGFMIGKE